MVRRHLLRLVALVFAIGLGLLLAPVGCAADDLNESLAGGACSADQKCAAGFVCVDGRCKTKGGADGGGDGDPCAACSAVETCCSGACVDLKSRPDHCGACD